MAVSLLPVLGALGGCAGWRVDQAAQVATGFASHLLCDDVFTTGVPPEQAFDERLRQLPGLSLVAPLLRRQVDFQHQEVTVSLAGWFESRAQRRPDTGCTTGPSDRLAAAGPAALPASRQAGTHASPLTGPAPHLASGPADQRLGEGPATGPSWPGPPPLAGPEPVRAATPALAAAIARAFVEPPGEPPHRTKAVVVLQQGRLIAEQYAPGHGPETPVLGFSATKTVVNALLGILVRQGRLAMDRPAAVPEWQGPGDARSAITPEHLLRQTSGLDLWQDNSGFDVASQIMYTAADQAAASAARPLVAPPGTRWAYTDGHFALLSGLMRRTLGGAPDALHQFAQRELFGPLGMRHVIWDTDASGTAIGASHLLAPARDWARLGQLLLDDGVAGGQRLLPEGWVAWSTTPTLATGYGAGLWTNRVPGKVPAWGVPWGLSRAPADAFFARGFMGQFVVVVPSRQLVVVRLAVSQRRGDDIGGTDALVGDILQALDAPGARAAQAGQRALVGPASGG